MLSRCKELPNRQKMRSTGGANIAVGTLWDLSLELVRHPSKLAFRDFGFYRGGLPVEPVGRRFKITRMIVLARFVFLCLSLWGLGGREGRGREPE